MRKNGVRQTTRSYRIKNVDGCFVHSKRLWLDRDILAGAFEGVGDLAYGDAV
jgi:hypothetical protein